MSLSLAGLVGAAISFCILRIRQGFGWQVFSFFLASLVTAGLVLIAFHFSYPVGTPVALRDRALETYSAVGAIAALVGPMIGILGATILGQNS